MCLVHFTIVCINIMKSSGPAITVNDFFIGPNTCLCGRPSCKANNRHSGDPNKSDLVSIVVAVVAVAVSQRPVTIVLSLSVPTIITRC